MNIYAIWYMRPEWFAWGSLGRWPDINNIQASHIKVKDLSCDSADGALERIFHDMQGEVWSPNGEARDLIRAKGLAHTSMSVGDLVIDDEGVIHLVAPAGFVRLHPQGA